MTYYLLSATIVGVRVEVGQLLPDVPNLQMFFNMLFIVIMWPSPSVSIFSQSEGGQIMDRWQVARWVWTVVVVFVAAFFVKETTTLELIDDDLHLDYGMMRSYEVVNSDAQLASKEWFAIRSDGELIPANTDGGYHLKVGMGQRWTFVNETYVQLSSPELGYVRVLSHVGFGEFVVMIAFGLAIGLVVWLCGGIFLGIFD